ncbi:MAG: glycosyltransferase family 2 protein [Bryobacteraceae bacterium]
MSATRISAIVPLWNGEQLLESLLDSLACQTVPPAEILVVDNSSADGGPALAQRRGARVIPMGYNAGFAAAVNRGIAEVSTEFTAVLNTDVTLDPDYFEKLAARGAWFATGRILKQQDPARLDATFDLLSRAATSWRAGNGLPYDSAFQQARAISSAPWTAALFRTEIFSRVGMLDTSFESYLEDVDFGLRAAALGLTGEYVPEAVAYHVGSASLGRWHHAVVRRIARNQVFLLARHYPRRLLLRWLWPILAGQSLWGLVALRHGAGLAWCRGKLEGLWRFRALRARSQPLPPQVLGDVIRPQERLLRLLQPAAGRDLYWRLYFLLTGSGAE